MRLLFFMLLAFTSLRGVGQDKIQKEINYIHSLRKEPDRIIVELGNKPQLCFIPVKNNPNYAKYNALVQPYNKKENLFEIGIQELTGTIKSLKVLSKNEATEYEFLKPYFPVGVAAVSASEMPGKYYDTALELYNQQQYQEAISTIDKAIVINTQDPQYHQLKALCLSHLMQYKESSDEVRYALEMDRANAELYEIMANNYYFLKDNENAVKNYEKAIEYERENISRIYHNYIRCLIEIPNAQRAIKVYKLYQYRSYNLTQYADATGNLENDLEFYAAQAYQQIEDWKTALEIYDRLIVISPDVYGYRAQRGRLYQQKGDFLPAIKDFEIALKLDANQTILWTNLAQIYQELGEYKKAETAYNEYLSKNTHDAVQLSNYGYLLLDEEHYKEAQAKFEASFKIDEKSLDTHIGRILVAHLLGNAKEKKQLIANAKSQFPQVKINTATLKTLMKTGNYYYSEKMITIWEDAID
ncbi:lipopolysaccharide assembly protein LapB [Flavobacterium sp. JAS]|uniref:tetratricopeptide repeat protein n=1 Tax=Flavobacterium sp. JAS TaxID=2897329 RepID=UPI001E3D7F16|nr:tetratricopeptide repeat protein [Flavobacterium sp. JAS]MCD0468735.1 tetratricopeptide repeat protein [Flavobacterium sp. JAS]